MGDGKMITFKRTKNNMGQTSTGVFADGIKVAFIRRADSQNTRIFVKKEARGDWGHLDRMSYSTVKGAKEAFNRVP